MSRQSSQGGGSPHLALAALLLICSGAAALTYQVAWVRLLSLSVGSTSEAVATVLAAFFFGLGAGSLLAGKLVRGDERDLGVYVGLELILGASGMALYWVLLNLNRLVVQAPLLGGSELARFGLAFVLLSVPTVAMGATFPVLAAVFVRRREELGVRIGQLYSLNTVGGVAGAVLSGFVLIPRFGLGGAVHAAVLLNVLAGAAAYLARPRLRLAAPEVREGAEAPDAGGGARGAALAVLALTGFVSIAAEVGWTRALSIFTGTTVFGFSAILAVFLTGIALGSWVMKARLARVREPRLALAVGLVLLGAALLATRSGLALVPDVYRWANGLEVSGAARNAIRYGVVFALLLPSTFLFGALYPLSLRVYCGGVEQVGQRVGRAYAVNTFASIAGSLCAGFWLIPAGGTDGVLLGLALAVLAAPVLLFAVPRTVGFASRVLAPAAALAAAAAFLPGLDFEALIRSVEYRRDAVEGEQQTAELLYLGEGKNGVVSAVTYDGRVAVIQNNGLQEALIDLENPRFGSVVEGLLGLLPYFLHPAPQSAFVVGFGGGTTVHTLSFTDLASIRVVELERKVVDAVRRVHLGELEVLDDARIELSFNDARNTLLLEQRSYDLIVSQPSHPWLAGAGNLFTREFFGIVRSRLNEGGIFCQWVNLFRMDELTLRSIVATFYHVFPHGFVGMNAATGDLFLLGSDAAPLLRHERVAGAIDASPDLRRFLWLHDLRQPGDLLWFFYTSRRGALALAGDATLNTDENLLSEVRLAALGTDVPPELSPGPLLQANLSLDVQPYLDPQSAGQVLFEAGSFFGQFQDFARAEVVLQILRESGDTLFSQRLEQSLAGMQAERSDG
ncbi:MAG: fused MFS/spermidine synthase [Planctomycetota bacterium]